MIPRWKHLNLSNYQTLGQKEVKKITREVTEQEAMRVDSTSKFWMDMSVTIELLGHLGGYSERNINLQHLQFTMSDISLILSLLKRLNPFLQSPAVFIRNIYIVKRI